MKKILTLIIIPILINSQVGINTSSPTETLDINGSLRIRNVDENCIEWILGIDNSGVVKKININELINACPILDRNQSNGKYLLFFSNNSIPKPNNPIKIDNTNLNSAGSWINNNTYYYSWTKNKWTWNKHK